MSAHLYGNPTRGRKGPCRSGQGAGTKHKRSGPQQHPENHCPLCTSPFGKNNLPIPVLLDKRTAVRPHFIPDKLDGQTVAICGECRTAIMTGRYDHSRPNMPEQIVKSNCTFYGGEDPAIGKARCVDCGALVHHSAKRCNACSNFVKGRKREAKNRKAKQEAK